MHQAACGNAFRHRISDCLQQLRVCHVLDLTDEGPKRTNSLGTLTKKEFRNGTLIEAMTIILVDNVLQELSLREPNRVSHQGQLTL